jgi:hypothetical protein
MDTTETILIITLFLVMLYRLYKSSQQSLLEEQDDEETISAVLIKVEKYQDQIYFWDRDTGDFIIQGKDMNEIVDKCKKYFPERYFCIEQEDVEKYDLRVKETPV